MSSSFAYIYEGSAQQMATHRELARFEGECTRLGIQGSALHGARLEQEEAVCALLKTGVKNLVCIGSQASFFLWLPFMMKYREPTYAFVPAEACALGQALGMPAGPLAASFLAARVVKTLDLGLANERPFFTEAVALDTRARLFVENAYTLSSLEPSPLSIRNLALNPKTGEPFSLATDGELEAVFQTVRETSSWFGMWPRKTMEETCIKMKEGCATLASGESLSFLVDGERLTSHEVHFSCVPASLKLIVGPDRLM